MVRKSFWQLKNIGNRSGMVLLTLGKHIMTIKKVKGLILVHMLFWVGLKKQNSHMVNSPQGSILVTWTGICGSTFACLSVAKVLLFTKIYFWYIFDIKNIIDILGRSKVMSFTNLMVILVYLRVCFVVKSLKSVPQKKLYSPPPEVCSESFWKILYMRKVAS